ncbi:hypothetical protein D5282_21430 [bacterium 1xD8-48]|nr:hypothetical protein [bacterium 1xD8-48]
MYERYKDITKLMLFDAVPYGDICVMENYSNLLWGMTGISDLKQALVLVGKLEKICCDYSFDEIIASSYAKGLLNLSIKQELPEQKETVEELVRMAKKQPFSRA